MYFKGKFRFFLSLSLFLIRSFRKCNQLALPARHSITPCCCLGDQSACENGFFIFIYSFFPTLTHSTRSLTNLYCHPVHSSTCVQVQAFSTMTSVRYSIHVIQVFSRFSSSYFFNHVRLTDRFSFTCTENRFLSVQVQEFLLAACREFSCCPLKKTVWKLFPSWMSYLVTVYH